MYGDASACVGSLLLLSYHILPFNLQCWRGFALALFMTSFLEYDWIRTYAFVTSATISLSFLYNYSKMYIIQKLFK